MIKLFDDKFVHFRWTDELEDKLCFIGDNILMLEKELETIKQNII